MEPGGSIDPPLYFFVAMGFVDHLGPYITAHACPPLQIFEPSAAPAVCKRMPNKLIFLNTKGQKKSEGNCGVLKYFIFW